MQRLVLAAALTALSAAALAAPALAQEPAKPAASSNPCFRMSQIDNHTKGDDQTLYLYLIEGNLAADENLERFEQKACAMLLSSGAETSEAELVRVKAGPKGARFLLLAAKPLREPIAWGGPIVMNSQEELNQAFADLRANTFIKHKQPKVY